MLHRRMASQQTALFYYSNFQQWAESSSSSYQSIIQSTILANGKPLCCDAYVHDLSRKLCLCPLLTFSLVYDIQRTTVLCPNEVHSSTFMYSKQAHGLACFQLVCNCSSGIRPLWTHHIVSMGFEFSGGLLLQVHAHGPAC